MFLGLAVFDSTFSEYLCATLLISAFVARLERRGDDGRRCALLDGDVDGKEKHERAYMMLHQIYLGLVS